MSLTGKGFFIHRVRNCEGGDPQAVATQAERAGLSRVIIKVVDGSSISNFDINTRTDLVSPLTKSLHEVGIETWGWGYVRGDDPMGEARVAVKRARDLKLDGFVIFAQEEYKQPGKNASARHYMSLLRRGLRNIPLALSSYSYPSYHPQLPWRTFLEKCDYNMPKVFWIEAHNPGAHLTRSFNEFDSLWPYRTIVPVGAAYSKENWQPTSRDIDEFLRTADALNLSAVNFWSWDSARSPELSTLWDAVRGTQYTVSALPYDIVGEYITALNSHDENQVIKLYSSRGVHVTADRTIKGADAIQEWYREFFTKTFPSAAFDLTGFSGEGNSRHFSWRALSESSAPSSVGILSGYKLLFKGVFYNKQKKRTPREHTIHTVIIDLDDPDIDLMVTPRAGLGRTTSSFLRKYHLQVAVNGDEWVTHDHPKGLAISEGDKYASASPEPSVFISKENQVQFFGPSAPIWDAISGSHSLVRNGLMRPKILSCRKPDVYCRNLAPRTGIGITRDNLLILIVSDGSPLDKRASLTLKELAQLFLDLGAMSAISFDGGGSSTLAVETAEKARVYNMPSDGRERAVSNHLGIAAKKIDADDKQVIANGSDTFGLVNEKIAYHLTRYQKITQNKSSSNTWR
jgi:hypothetical protein